MKINTLIALRSLAANELKAATTAADAAFEQLRQARELSAQAEADGADAETLAQYREDVRDCACVHRAACDRRHYAQDVLDDLDGHDWH